MRRFTKYIIIICLSALMQLLVIIFMSDAPEEYLKMLPKIMVEFAGGYIFILVMGGPLAWVVGTLGVALLMLAIWSAVTKFTDLLLTRLMR